MNFEEYLRSKKIDSSRFRSAEESVWKEWKDEFEQIHPSSFTSQKLFMINPLRRLYPLQPEPQPAIAKKDNETPENEKNQSEAVAPGHASEVPKQINKPVVSKPVMRPKPKMT